MTMRSTLSELGIEEDEPEPLFDPEDVPLTEHVCVVSSLDVEFDPNFPTSQIIPLAVGIDSSRWATAQLVVLLHRQKSWSATSQMRITLWQIALTPEDPSEIFRGGDEKVIKLYATTVPPALEVETFSPGAAQLAVELKWEQFEESTETQFATISVYLVGHLHRPPEAPLVSRLRESEGDSERSASASASLGGIADRHRHW